MDERLKWLEVRISSSLRPRNEDLKNMMTNDDNRYTCTQIGEKVTRILLPEYYYQFNTVWWNLAICFIHNPHSGNFCDSLATENWTWAYGQWYSYCLKPVLNWANVCLLNILQTVQRTMIHFLIELLVRRTCFGQSKLYFVLKWLVMRCKLWTCGRRAADSMVENVG